MALPLFPPERDPGPDFVGLLRLTAGRADAVRARLEAGRVVRAPHGTTVVALRYADGVVMAGDRRATAGNIIAHHAMEKVFPADRHSAVAIAGTAGMAIEMVRLFQVQLEHYEKVEGSTLSLEGKANQLAQMVRQHLPMAMQGLAVVPLFAGYDTTRGTGRIFNYDVTGGHYEDTDFQATGLGRPRRRAAPSSSAGARAWPRTRRSTWRSSRSTTPPTRTPPPAGPTRSAASTRSSPSSTRQGYREVPEAEVAERFGALIARKQAERAP